MPLSLPIYFLGRTFVLHTRIHGRQFKRSLKTADPRIAKIRAIQLLGAAQMAIFPRFSKPSSATDAEWRRFELDAKNGVFKSDGSDKDYERMMEAYERWKSDREVEAIGPIPGGFPIPAQQQAVGNQGASDAIPDPHFIGAGSDMECKAKGPTYSVVYADYVKLNPTASKGTKRDYEDTVKEFEKFAGKPTISKICGRTITDYMKWLADKGNLEPTIDKKIGALRALFNFGKKQDIVSGENFAAGRNLQTRKEKNAGGHKFYELDEIKEVMGCPQFHQLAQTEPSFRLVAIAALITGIRITPLATLAAEDFRKTVEGRPYISVGKDKSPAGVRKVPIPEVLSQQLKDYLEQNGSFGFDVREDGGGAGDPVRKILNTHLAAIGAMGRGFTVHGLRKSLNQCFIEDDVDFEARCQFLGHEIDHVNLSVYGKGAAKEKMSIDKLAQKVRPTQDRLMALIGFGQLDATASKTESETNQAA
jgi:site-specific recombinase XerD